MNILFKWMAVIAILWGYARAGQPIDDAISFLQSSTPTPYAIASADSTKSDLFHRQLNALQDIEKGKKTSLNIVSLIPYLNYATSAGALTSRPPTGLNEKELLEVSKKTWPAFSIIVETTSAAPVLKSYSLDSTKPIDYRLAALIILRYMDKAQFQDICNDAGLNKKITDLGGPYVPYFHLIEKGKIEFWGVLPVEYNTR